jgi:hypothetical protein
MLGESPLGASNSSMVAVVIIVVHLAAATPAQS